MKITRTSTRDASVQARDEQRWMSVVVQVGAVDWIFTFQI